MRGRLTLAVVASAALMLCAPAASAREAIVESFDGTPIVTHFFPAQDLGEGERAPTVMIGHGWGGSGESDPESETVTTYTSRGYNVLTWDARGFGGSGGTVMIDHPRFEGRDAQALIDFIADQPEARRDGRGDPRVGMDGPSYGGGIQLITAARDDRIDAIAPTIAWNSLNRSLYRSEVVKAGWDLALVGVGIPTSIAPGLFSPAGIQTGHQSDLFYDAVVDGVTTGALDGGFQKWLREHGPRGDLGRIDAPTLIVQGTVDTLFTLDEAHDNYVGLDRRTDVPLKMMWFCGGHGVCLTESDGSGGAIPVESPATQAAKIDWFARYLKGRRSVDTGPRFEWIDEDGAWHSSAAYPLRRTERIQGEVGSGVIALTPGTAPASGFLIFASPSPTATVRAPIEIPEEGSTVVGRPLLGLEYTATGTSPPPTARTNRTAVFAQIVDRGRDVVVNNQVTPVPIRLDGERHKVHLPLERMASMPTSEGYELELVPSTSVHDFQRALGAVEVHRARVTLRVSEPR